MKIDFNHHTSIKNDGLKTTSSLESWHKKFSKLVGSPKLFIYKFVDALKEEQDYNEKRYDELLFQRSQTKKNIKSFDKYNAVKDAVSSDYDTENPLKYLKKIAEALNIK